MKKIFNIKHQKLFSQNIVCSKLASGILLIIGLFCNYFASATVRYVHLGNAGASPYTSWATAGGNLQDVIDYCAAGDEVWVVQGTY